ncbi:MAG: hypothetical protein EBV92_09010, partial [Betaproteobacteria bacterium]|nr:hypothetical protein [Betaproteobacteria bacterium]
MTQVLCMHPPLVKLYPANEDIPQPGSPAPTQPSLPIPTQPGLPVLNIAAYRFVLVNDRDRLQKNWLERCLGLKIKGTILIAPE